MVVFWDGLINPEQLMENYIPMTYSFAFNHVALNGLAQTEHLLRVIFRFHEE